MLVYTKQDKQDLGFVCGDEDVAIVQRMAVASANTVSASAVLSCGTVELIVGHLSTFDPIIPEDREAVEGGIKAWRREVWSTAFKQLADAVGIPANVRKAIAPYVSDLGSALWYNVPITEGDKARSISAIREDLAEFRESKTPAERIVGAVNAVAPIKNGAVNAIWTRHDAALACALLTAEQISALRELVYLLDGKPFLDAEEE